MTIAELKQAIKDFPDDMPVAYSQKDDSPSYLNIDNIEVKSVLDFSPWGYEVAFSDEKGPTFKVLVLSYA